jgi:glycosyltransferase involved in cell wall biosynthesis
MNNYIFLTNYYLPTPGATGMCVHQLAKKLAKKNNVFTVCYEDGDNTKVIDNVKIIKIKIPSYLKNNGTQNETFHQIHYVESLVRKLVHIKDYPLRSNGLVNQYLRVIDQIVKDYDKVTIIATFTPLEAVVAAYKIKKKCPEKVKIVYYSTDTLSNEQGNDGILPASYRTKCGVRWEKKLFSAYDKILIMECHKDHYFNSEYESFREKMEIVNFPLFTKMDDLKTEVQPSDVVSFTYTGTFYRVLRNPQFMCDCLLGISKKKNIKVDILGGGDCNDILEQTADKSNGAIQFHGMQSHDVAMKYLNSADVLLSIGNAESPMAPSKIFEYMSTGKPIIHTYTYDKDPCIEPLKKYGNALLIHEKDKDAVDKIINFITDYRIIEFKKVENIFIMSTPGYTTTIIENLANNE